jgi:hypothetical protein
LETWSLPLQDFVISPLKAGLDAVRTGFRLALHEKPQLLLVCTADRLKQALQASFQCGSAWEAHMLNVNGVTPVAEFLRHWIGKASPEDLARLAAYALAVQGTLPLKHSIPQLYVLKTMRLLLHYDSYILLRLQKDLHTLDCSCYEHFGVISVTQLLL